MNRAEFEAELNRDGYEHRPPRTHGFDARLFILSGIFTIDLGQPAGRPLKMQQSGPSTGGSP